MSDATPGSPDELIESHIPLVGHIVAEVASRLPAHVSKDDLHSAGLVGLVQAGAAYQAERGVPFRRYAAMRIRGAIVDELRAADWASRSSRAQGRRRDVAVEQLGAALGRTPNQAEIASFLGVTVAELDQVDKQLKRTVVLSLDAALDPDAFAGVKSSDPTPEDYLIEGEQLAYLRAAVENLDERLRTVVTMYFLEGKPMADIAAKLGVGESRISQMRAEALELLKDGINSQLDPDQVKPVGREGGCVERRRATYFAAVAASSTFRTMTAVEDVVPAQRPARAGVA